ncbi:uncharacterized protein LOC133135646 [Conger conger]|uniref:uncharacterized protein LOC133135646 n=1 Tax=Conger conger TaxID=82655 RepID=UPI002A5AB03D|nr:uncharacterized protein LOC133135646 [Conger conger]
MESAGKPGNLGPSGFLVIPNGSSFEAYEYEVEGRIKPKSSPLPRRRGSESPDSDDSAGEPTPSRSRKVSFADAFGLSLVSVKEFDHRDVPPPAPEAPEGAGARDAAEEHFLSSLFTVPASAEELLGKLRGQMCELECVELLPGTTSLRGTVRVLNLSFDKAVYVRTTLDGWATHFDLLAEFVPGSSDGETDRFMFKITLVPPFKREGARVEFCLRYEIPGRTFWANNNGMNYVLFCHKRASRDAKDSQQDDIKYKNKKSCLKSKDNSSERTSLLFPGETADAPIQKQEVVVSMVTPVPHSEGLHEDGAQTALVDSYRDYSWRSRRRAARLARMRNPFYQNEGEGEDGVGSGQEEEEGSYVEEPLDASTPPHWETASDLPGLPNTTQTNGTEEAQKQDLIPPASLKSERNDIRNPFKDWSRENSDTASANLQEVDTGSYHPKVRTSALGSWESWNTFVDFGDAWAPSRSSTTAPDEGASQNAAFDPAAYLEEDTSEWSQSSNGPPAECSNTESPAASGDSGENASECPQTDIADLHTSECPQTDIADLRGREMEPGNWPIIKDGRGSDRTPAERDAERDKRGVGHDGLWTEAAEVWQRFPFDSYLTPVARLESSDIGLEAASGDLLKTDTGAPRRKELVKSQGADSRPTVGLESSDAGFESVSGHPPNTDINTPRHKEPINSQDEGPVNHSKPPQETGNTDSEVIVDEGIGHAAECVKHYHRQRVSGGDAFGGAADLALNSEETGTQTEVTDIAVAQQSRRPEPISLNEFDNSSPSSAMNSGIDGSMQEPFRSCLTFTLSVRGKGDNVKDSDEDVCRARGDREQDDSKENVEGTYKVEKEASMENDNSFHEDEEDVTAEETTDLSGKSKEDALVERGDLRGDDTSAEDREDPSEEQMLIDYEEDLYDEEDISMENEDDFYDEENEDFYGQEELPISTEEELEESREEVSILAKDFGLEQEDTSAETEEDLEVAQILGGMNKALSKEALSMKMEESDKVKKIETYQHKKGNEEHTHSNKEVNITDGGKVFHEEFKKCWEVGEGSCWRKEGLVQDGGTEGTLSTQPQPDKVTTGPSVSSVRIRPAFLPSTNKPKHPWEPGEARDVPGSPPADLDPVEEPGYRTTVHLPPVEKVENVARNYLLCWWDVSSHNLSRVFLYALLFLVFLVTAFHYDFLACFAVYLITVYWFCFHRENGIEQARGP